MKILSIQNHKMQKMQSLQNSNTRPVAFGGFRSVVVAGDSMDVGRFMAVALRLTEKDLTDFQDVLKEFRNPNLDADVLSIRAETHIGDATEDVYQVLVNGHDFFNTAGVENSDGELVLDFGKFTRQSEFKEKLKELLAKLRGAKNLDVPKGKAEKTKMIQALSGAQTLSQDEFITDKSLRNDILERLHNLLDEDGRVFNVESLND